MLHSCGKIDNYLLKPTEGGGRILLPAGTLIYSFLFRIVTNLSTSTANIKLKNHSNFSSIFVR
jgi:hypothetical protein